MSYAGWTQNLVLVLIILITFPPVPKSHCQDLPRRLSRLTWVGIWQWGAAAVVIVVGGYDAAASPDNPTAAETVYYGGGPERAD